MQVAVSFTGGKDSTLVCTLLQMLQKQPEFLHTLPAAVQTRLQPYLNGEVTMLVTFVPAGGASFKAHPLQLIKLQAEALQLPHHVLEVSAPFLESYQQNIRQLRSEHGIEALVTGDILDVCNGFMCKAADTANSGVALWTPLWAISRTELLELLWQLGIEPVISCVNLKKFTPSSPDAAADSNADMQDPAAPCRLQSSNNTAQSSTAATPSSAATAPHQPNSNGTSFIIRPESDLLGKPLTRELHSQVLIPAMRHLGVDECGEMGEFHTLVVDGPTFHARLVVESTGSSDGDYCFLVPGAASLKPKEAAC